MNLRCKIFGCVGSAESHGYDCMHCGCNLYEYGFVEREHCWLRWWYNLKFRWEMNKWRNRHTCGNCGRAMFFTDESCCSEECYESWIPF